VGGYREAGGGVGQSGLKARTMRFVPQGHRMC
jgi:hypothetical protein